MHVRKAKGQSGANRFERSHRLIEDFRRGLVVGNLWLGCFRNLITATGAGRDVAISEQQFRLEQADPFARPKNAIADAVRKIDIAGFVGPDEASMTVVETRKMPADNVVTSRMLPKVRYVTHTTRDHRVWICTLRLPGNVADMGVRHQR